MNEKTNETGPASGGETWAQPDRETLRMIRDVPLQEGDWAVECSNPGHFRKIHPRCYGEYASQPGWSYFRPRESSQPPAEPGEKPIELLRKARAVPPGNIVRNKESAEPGETPGPKVVGAPERIWLCCGEIESDWEFESSEDLTWTEHGPVDDTDPGYIRISAFLDLKRENAALSAEVERLRGLLREMADANNVDDPCEYDHNGRCQSHWLYERPCLAERVREALRTEAGKDAVSEALAGIELVGDPSLPPGTAVLRSGSQKIVFKIDEGKEP